MAVPHRGQTSSTTYFITAGTFWKKNLLQSDRMAELFCETLFHYRSEGKFLLHAFIVMPNHIHLLLTVSKGLTLERAVQLIKGGFSHEASKRMGNIGPVWQKSFVDRRVRNLAEFEKFREYIHQNPVRAGMVHSADQYLYSSVHPAFVADELPQRLKPQIPGPPIMHR
jgi:putative transposase